MAAPMEEPRAERLEVRRRTPTDLPDISTRFGLTAEVANTAVRRLGFLALAVALLVPSAYWVEKFIQPERTAGSIQFSVENIFFPAAGLVVCVLAWSRKFRPMVVLDIGLIFQVIAALALSLTESTPPWPDDQMLRGASWNCLWITVYVITIPGALGKTALAAVVSACMGPLGLLIARVSDPAYSGPTGPQVLNALLPFAAAGWSIPVARSFYHLRAQVTRARALGSYELLELIGKGGMGEVWSARHRMLARVSAIKLIRPEALSAELGENVQVMLRRFEREARVTAALRSPHTVALYDYGITDDGKFYYAMELLDGLDLDTLVHRFGPLPAGRVAWLLSQAAKSLAEAHDIGLVHRDIKPRNIFACRLATEFDFAKVLDFGLVKLTALGSAQTCLTREGVTTGTPAYMAPEIAMGRPEVDGRADLYSLGCVGYWLLTGHLVFEADGAVAMALAHVQERPVPPSRRTEIEVPEALDRLVLQCLEKDPAARPETALRLVELLADCEGVEPWTQKQAEQWWHTHLPQKSPDRMVRSAASGGETV